MLVKVHYNSNSNYFIYSHIHLFATMLRVGSVVIYPLRWSFTNDFFTKSSLFTWSVTNWLTDWLTDWLIGRLTDWLACWQTDRQTNWLTDCRTEWLGCWLSVASTNWLTVSATDRLSDWVTWLIDRLIHWLIDWLTDWLIAWLIDWLIDWLIAGRIILYASAMLVLSVIFIVPNVNSSIVRSRRTTVGPSAVGPAQIGFTPPPQVLNDWCVNLTRHLNTTLEKFVGVMLCPATSSWNWDIYYNE